VALPTPSTRCSGGERFRSGTPKLSSPAPQASLRTRAGPRVCSPCRPGQLPRLRTSQNPLGRCCAGGGMQRRTPPASGGPAVPGMLGYALTESSAGRDDPVPRFQSRHATPDLQHFSDAFAPSHGRQRGEDGVGPCREAGGELQTSAQPRPPQPRSRLRTRRDIPLGALRRNPHGKKVQPARHLGSC